MIRDGELRRAQLRARRRETLTFAGVGALAVAIVGVIALAVVTGPQQGDDDDDAASVTESGADATEAPEGTAPAATTGDTEAATDTTSAAGAETTAAGATETTSAEAETGDTAAGTPPAVPDHTTIGGSVTHDGVLPGLLPISLAVRVDASVIFEAPASGTSCGPTAVSVSYERFDPIPDIPVVHWRVAGVSGEAPMTIGERPTLALATVGPFPAETLDAGDAHELLIFITTSGEAEVLRRADGRAAGLRLSRTRDVAPNLSRPSRHGRGHSRTDPLGGPLGDEQRGFLEGVSDVDHAVDAARPPLGTGAQRAAGHGRAEGVRSVGAGRSRGAPSPAVLRSGHAGDRSAAGPARRAGDVADTGRAPHGRRLLGVLPVVGPARPHAAARPVDGASIGPQPLQADDRRAAAPCRGDRSPSPGSRSALPWCR